MSFIDTYIEKYRLDSIKPKTKKNLAALENKLSDATNDASSFEDIIKDQADIITDLINRVSEHFRGRKFSFKNVVSSFRFVISISTEIYQIVEQIKSSIISRDMTENEIAAAKHDFGVDLVWFVWMTVGPLDKVFTWMPFKKTIEKMLVRWIAGMALKSAVDLFTTNKEVSSFAVNAKTEHIKAL